MLALESISSNGFESVEPFQNLLNRYKLSVDLELVFDSESDFLYRQSGQLKIGSTVLEEFLPRLVWQVFSDRLAEYGLVIGPASTLTGLTFDTNLIRGKVGEGMSIRSKDHDFVIGRQLHLWSSHHEDSNEPLAFKTTIPYLATEIKTNLDKTMFQEANATSRDLKLTVQNSRYLLLCEWLDMTPISTVGTSIDEVILLRKAKRLSAQVRQNFGTVSGRRASRNEYEDHLNEHPFSLVALDRFLAHVEGLFSSDTRLRDALDLGWF